jgi:hypothetical protein
MSHSFSGDTQIAGEGYADEVPPAKHRGRMPVWARLHSHSTTMLYQQLSRLYELSRRNIE